MNDLTPEKIIALEAEMHEELTRQFADEGERAKDLLEEAIEVMQHSPVFAAIEEAPDFQVIMAKLMTAATRKLGLMEMLALTPELVDYSKCLVAVVIVMMDGSERVRDA